MDLRPGDEPRQGTQSTKNHSYISYIKCLLGLRDENEKLEVR